MKVVIIEDEKAAVRNLRALLSEQEKEMEILAEPDSVTESIDWFRTQPMPGLLFMDIHLADGSAFEIFEFVDITCPVIFTTAYNEYALKAFKVNSIDYLLKPIGQEDIRKALQKLEQLTGTAGSPQPDYHNLLKVLRQKESYKTHFLVPVKGDKLLPLPVETIFYFHIEDGMVKAVTRDNQSFTLPHNLDELTGSLDPATFFRVNRQYLVARKAVLDIDLWFNSRLSVNLRVPVKEKIVVSKARVAEFKEWFTGEL
ncbi:MAG: LytTR family DNA-binding domain-containing protein [Tannerellaceae bacterium]|nr:LytTR family DNA-binding domain-containing protein [Tannerellaceae bacterium]